MVIESICLQCWIIMLMKWNINEMKWNMVAALMHLFACVSELKSTHEFEINSCYFFWNDDLWAFWCWQPAKYMHIPIRSIVKNISTVHWVFKRANSQENLPPTSSYVLLTRVGRLLSLKIDNNLVGIIMSATYVTIFLPTCRYMNLTFPAWKTFKRSEKSSHV